MLSRDTDPDHGDDTQYPCDTQVMRGDRRVMMPGSPSLLSGHTMAVVFTMDPGSMDSTSLSIPDHGL